MITWGVVIALWVFSFFVVEFYALAVRHIPSLKRKCPRLPVIPTLSETIWTVSIGRPYIPFALGSLFTGLFFHFFGVGWCAP